jgi:hypothetical protein
LADRASRPGLSGPQWATGTLTKGEHAVTAVLGVDIDESEVLRLAGGVEAVCRQGDIRLRGPSWPLPKSE